MSLQNRLEADAAFGAERVEDALGLLQEALQILDALSAPSEIRARLNDVVEALTESCSQIATPREIGV